MADEIFDDAPRWYWAVDSGRADSIGSFQRADDRFVVACGQPELWARVRAEVEPSEQCSWLPFGPSTGEPTLADCIRVLLTAREMYGASYNRLVLELARVPAFAKFIYEAKWDICNSISNPINDAPLLREPYSRDVQERLGARVEQTLGLPNDDWRR